MNWRKTHSLFASWSLFVSPYTGAFSKNREYPRFHVLRGGGWIDGDTGLPEESIKDDETSETGGAEEMIGTIRNEIDLPPMDREFQPKETTISPKANTKRVTSAVLESFLDNDDTESPSTRELREIISRKMLEYLEECSDRAAIKLIHSMAPKIPAIRHSPDVTLRIRATASDPDPGIAACLIAASGKLVESLCPQDKEKARVHVGKDRRFEQACECILSGIKEEDEKNFFDSETWSHDASFKQVDESVSNPLEEGLSLRDCCRAAYGLSSLCDHESFIGKEKVSVYFQTLMRRVCCLLRLEFLRLVTSELEDCDGISVDDYLSKSCRRLAENALLALWSFSKTQMTNLSLKPLVEFCSTILCLDPLQLRQRYQEKSDNLGANDVVDRLIADSDENAGQSSEQRDVLVDWLTTEEIIDTAHALAQQCSQERALEDEDHLLGEICFDRLLHAILEESKNTTDFAMEQTGSGNEPITVGVKPVQDNGSVEDHNTPSVEYVDASTLLATENKQQPDSQVKESRGAHPSVFSSLDLCTIAWSATELDASLRSRIVSRVLRLLSSQTSEQIALENLSLWALVGAAWAFSKIDESDEGVGDFSIGSDVLVVGWIVDDIMRRRRLDPDIFRLTPASLLSRFAWSIGVLYDKRVDGTRIATTDASDLIREILTLAAANQRTENERFSTEDQDKNLREDPNIAKHLGILIRRVESSLLLWERGTPDSGAYDEELPLKGKLQSGRKPRGRVGRQYFRIPFSERRHSESDGGVQIESPSDMSALPHLRDLPVDPHTLCKLSNACEKSFSNEMGFNDSLTRIALRLYTSNARGGKMMSEISTIDLVRLLEAVASNDLSSGRELVSYFARLSVRHLNRRERIKANIKTFATLSWALGSLGVKYRPDEEKHSDSAFKRLNLVAELVVSEAHEDCDFRLLSNRRLLKLLSGIVKMKSMEYFSLVCLRTLEVLMERIHQMDETQLCGLLQTTGSLLTSLRRYRNEETKDKQLFELLHSVELALTKISTQCESMVHSAKPSTLRLISATVLDMKLDANNLIDLIELEASCRLESSDQLEHATSFEAIFELPETNKTNAVQNEGPLAPFESIKVTLQSLFATDEEKQADKLSSPVDIEKAKQLFGKAEALRKLHGSTGLTHAFDSIFELGRCLELVSEYRKLHRQEN